LLAEKRCSQVVQVNEAVHLRGWYAEATRSEGIIGVGCSHG
jgi:hypothetical protein